MTTLKTGGCGGVRTLRQQKWAPSDLSQASEGMKFPVLLKGCCRPEVEAHEWSLGRMLALDPEAEVTVEYYPDADRRLPYEQITRPFKDLAGPMADEPEKWFIAERNFDEVFPRVAPDLPALSVLPVGARCVLRLVFFGTNSQSATHFHVRDQAILAHLRGRKRVVLAGPKATNVLATNSPFGGRPQFSTHGPESDGDALDYFTDLLGTETVSHVDMEPGDALFIPVHWWHWAEGYGENLSVTTFWRASLRNWEFPHPGVRAANAVVLGEAAKIVRGVAERMRT